MWNVIGIGEVRRREECFTIPYKAATYYTIHYTIVMKDFNAQIGKRTNPTEMTSGKSWFEFLNERKWATPRKYEIMCAMFPKKSARRWTWKSPNGVMKTEIDYILKKKQAKHRHRRNNHQPIEHCKWPQNGYEPHQAGPRARIK